jgi:hypothetical protein
MYCIVQCRRYCDLCRKYYCIIAIIVLVRVEYTAWKRWCIVDRRMFLTCVWNGNAWFQHRWFCDVCSAY